MVELSENPDTELAQQGHPALNPGRPADKPKDLALNIEQVSDDVEAEIQYATEEEVTPETVGTEAHRALSRQRRLRLMLRQCDRVVLLDFNLLAMPEWPDNYSVAMAQKRRDVWLFGACVAAVVFLSGLTGVVPAWLAGGGFGAFVIILLLGVPFVRHIYTDRPSYLDLVVRRKQLLRDAHKHIQHLEGDVGLAWQCGQMKDFNPALKSPRFADLIELSERGGLSGALTRREHVRLYLVFMLEAERAYERLQQAFFEGNQSAIDEGWEEVAAESIVKS